MRSILKTDKLSEVEIEDFKRKLRQQILEHDHIILVKKKMSDKRNKRQDSC